MSVDCTWKIQIHVPKIRILRIRILFIFRAVKISRARHLPTTSPLVVYVDSGSISTTTVGSCALKRSKSCSRRLNFTSGNNEASGNSRANSLFYCRYEAISLLHTTQPFKEPHPRRRDNSQPRGDPDNIHSKIPTKGEWMDGCPRRRLRSVGRSRFCFSGGA